LKILHIEDTAETSADIDEEYTADILQIFYRYIIA
jgi:hypothetical protein